MTKRLVVLFLGVALFTGTPVFIGTAGAQSQFNNGTAEGFGGFIGQKSSIKKATRWTLQDWLETRERMKWSDLWLSFNSPSPYEFFFSGSYAPTPGQWRYGVGAYAQGVGLEYEQETVFDPAWNARFHFRIFGVNVQNTNLTLHAGIRGRKEPDSFRQGYYGASLTLYLRQFFGIFAQYRNFAGSTPTALGKVTGYRFEVGPFIDFGPLRVFGYYLYESESADSTTIGYSKNTNFWNIGGQLFF